MCNFGPYDGRQNFGKNAEIVRKAAKMKKLSKNREKLGSVKGSHSFIATQLSLVTRFLVKFLVGAFRDGV